MTRTSLVSFLLLAACKADPTPAWAIDPIWLEPTEAGVHGFQTWQLYADRWERNQSESTFVCAVVVELVGVETPCTDCQIAWETTATLLETDCSQGLADDATWLGLERLSLGLAVDDAEAAHPGFTSQSFADYSYGWEVHGEAWPVVLDHGGTTPDGSWSGTEPFAFAPTLAWPVP